MNTETQVLPDVESVTWDEIRPPCEGKQCGHAPATGFVIGLCVTCDLVDHLLCNFHLDRLAGKTDRLFIHPPCGSPDTRIIRLERF